MCKRNLTLNDEKTFYANNAICRIVDKGQELVLFLQELSILWIWIGFLKRFSVCWNGCFGTLLETKKVRMSKLIPCGNRKLFQPTVGTNWLVASLKLVIQFHHYRQLHLPFHLGTKNVEHPVGLYHYWECYCMRAVVGLFFIGFHAEKVVWVE